MKIEASAKEIAALVVALQGRREECSGEDCSDLSAKKTRVLRIDGKPTRLTELQFLEELQKLI